jgi:transposase
MGMTKRMSVKINKLAEETRDILTRYSDLPIPLRDSLENLLGGVEMAVEYLSRNSRNSHTPPSQDNAKGNKEKRGKQRKNSDKKPGGQPGREGVNLSFSDEPTSIVDLEIDRRCLPPGNYTEEEPECRQVFDFEIIKTITEYRAQVLRGAVGDRYVAEFPEGVNAPTQYGANVQAYCVGLSTKNAMPYERLADHVFHELGISVSTGSLVNFEERIATKLEETFLPEAKDLLIQSEVVGFDETGISIRGEGFWAHEANNSLVVLFTAHKKRGKAGIDAAGILPEFKGIAVHDYWASYQSYLCAHALCNAHHLRDLEYIGEDPRQTWAVEMKALLLEMNTTTKSSKRKVKLEVITILQARYDQVVLNGLKQNPGTKHKNKRKAKARCLVERFRDRKDQILLFLHDLRVPFSNNDTERPIRMLKVEMKISGTFRSLATARRSLLIRSYLLTCQNHGIDHHEALLRVIQNDIPSFKPA